MHICPGVFLPDVTAPLLPRFTPNSTQWESQLAAVGLAPDVRVLTESQFHGLVEGAAAALTQGELRQAALEVLGRPVGHGTLDVEGLCGALFDYLDVCGEVREEGG